MFIAHRRLEAPALREECDVYNHESGSLGLLRLNMALLPECEALFFRVVYKHGTPTGVLVSSVSFEGRCVRSLRSPFCDASLAKTVRTWFKSATALRNSPLSLAVLCERCYFLVDMR
jgi:hypothetical protein